MKQAHHWRMAITNKIADYYRTYNEVAAIMTVGSLVHGYVDQFSDIDMAIYWHSAPPEQQRRVVAEQMDGFMTDMAESLPETDSALFVWEDVFYIGGQRSTGLKIDLNHMLLSSLDKMIVDVMEGHEHNRHKYMVLYSLNRSYIHFGAEILAPKFAQIKQCPIELAEKIIRDNLQLLPQSSYKMLAFREDWLFYNQIMTRACESILYMLYGLNRQFPPGRFKHLKFITSELTLGPTNLYERFVTILRGDTEVALSTLFSLTTEVYDLLDAHLPQIDTAEVRAWLESGRTELFEPPIR